MTSKQLKYFGTKRQKAAAKSSRKRKAKSSHRKRSNPIRCRTTKRATARRHTKRTTNPVRRKSAKRAMAKRSAHRRKAKRRNPVPQIISWAVGNPAKRRKKTVARRRTKKHATARRSDAGRRHTQKVTHRRRRSNPMGLGRPMDWVQGGAGVLAGVVGTRALPQMILGASNTGAMGYAANVIAAIGLGWGTHMLFPRNAVLTTAVIAGGFAATLSRVIADKTPFGAQLSLSGLGDWGLGLYQKSNFPYPPRIAGGRPGTPGSSMFTWGDGSQGVATAAMVGSDSTANC